MHRGLGPPRTCTANCLVSAVVRAVRSRRFSMSASVRSTLSRSSSAWRAAMASGQGGRRGALQSTHTATAGSASCSLAQVPPALATPATCCHRPAPSSSRPPAPRGTRPAPAWPPLASAPPAPPPAAHPPAAPAAARRPPPPPARPPLPCPRPRRRRRSGTHGLPRPSCRFLASEPLPEAPAGRRGSGERGRCRDCAGRPEPRASAARRPDLTAARSTMPRREAAASGSAARRARRAVEDAMATIGGIGRCRGAGKTARMTQLAAEQW